MIIILMCLYNILMSFFNFSHLLYTEPFYVSFPLYQYPFVGYNSNSSVPPLEVEQSLYPLQQTKTSHRSNELRFAFFKEKLKGLHFSSQKHKKSHWSIEEDKLLERLVQVQKLQWREIPQHFTNRTQNMCYSRYRRISMCTRDRLWSNQDQELAFSYVNKYGEKWKLISSKMPKFTPKQIRERYLNYLRPSINREDFSYEEDLIICQSILEHGKHWRKMQQGLPGRSEGCIKGRFYGKLQNIFEESFGSKDF